MNNLLTVFLGLAIALIALLVANRKSQGKPKGIKTVVIMGPSNAGKTCLFFQWIGWGNGTPRTVPSQTVNSSILSVPLEISDEKHGGDGTENTVELADIPGHSKLAYLGDEYLQRPNLLGVIYVVDAAGGPKGIQEAASGLFQLLQSVEKRPDGVEILIACNKSDIFSVLSTSRVKKLLEQAINELRQTQAKSLGKVGTGGDDVSEDDDWIWIGGDEAKEFTFDQLESRISVLEGSVKTAKTIKWQEWINSLV